MKKNFLKKVVSLFVILVGILVVSKGSVFAQTNPFTVTSSVDKTQATITVTYDLNIKPLPSVVYVAVKDKEGLHGFDDGTYYRNFDFQPATKNKEFFTVDGLKLGQIYYVQLSGYVNGSLEYKTSATFKTSDNTSPPIVDGKGLTMTYTSSAKDSLTVKVTNNSSSTYTALLYVSKTGSSSYLQSDINLGNIKPAQVVSKTITNLNSSTLYDIEIKGFKMIDGQSSSVAEKVTISNAKTQNISGTGTGVTPIGTGTGQTPSGAGLGATPKKDNSVKTGLGLDNPTNITSIEDFVAKALNIVVDIGTPLVAFFLILSGFMFVAARGNEEKLATAKRSLVYTLIGAALVLGCWGIAQAVKGTIQDVTKTSVIQKLEKDNFV